MQDGSLGIVIGDVSGHGIGSALLMASADAYLRSLVETHVEIGEILSRANRILAKEMEAGHFVTLLFARIRSPNPHAHLCQRGAPNGLCHR